MIEKIDINKIRGKWQTADIDNPHYITGMGDDTEQSLKLLANKINELVEVVNALHRVNADNYSYGDVVNTATFETNGTPNVKPNNNVIVTSEQPSNQPEPELNSYTSYIKPNNSSYEHKQRELGLRNRV